MWTIILISFPVIISAFSLGNNLGKIPERFLQSYDQLPAFNKNSRSQRKLGAGASVPPYLRNSDGMVSESEFPKRNLTNEVLDLSQSSRVALVPCVHALEMLSPIRSSQKMSAVIAFSNLYELVTSAHLRKRLHRVDKEALKYMSVIFNFFNKSRSSMPVADFMLLMNGCSVNTEGHDFYMRFLTLGLYNTFRSPIARNFTRFKKLKDIIDLNGNNIFHLAISSNNVYLLDEIFDVISEPVTTVIDLLTQKNIVNQTPLDVAFKHRDLQQSLKTHFYVYNFAKEYQIDQIPLSSRLITSGSSEFCQLAFKHVAESSSSAGPLVIAFRVMIEALSRHNYNKNNDKLVSRCLEIIRKHSIKLDNVSILSMLQRAIETCSVDTQGRTLFMKFVQEGLVETFENHLTYLMNDMKYHVDAKDLDGNNILHFAVLSNNKFVVDHIVCWLMDNLSHDKTRRLFEATNRHGLTPKDLASSRNMPEVVRGLSSYYALIARDTEHSVTFVS